MNLSTLSGTNPLIDFFARRRSLISVDETSTRRVDTVTTPSAATSFQSSGSPDLPITATIDSSRIRSGFRHLGTDGRILGLGYRHSGALALVEKMVGEGGFEPPTT